MNEFLFVGLDVSTQSCKVVVIDLEAKNVFYVDTVSYDDDLPEFKTRNGVIQGLDKGVSESDPKMWIEAINLIFTRMKEAGLPMDKIRCMSVSGQQHGLVALDAEGELSRPRSKLWNDFSTLEECTILTESIGGREAMIKEVGNSQRTGYTAPKILHMFRHERDAYDRTSVFLLVHNYINWYLSDGRAVMEPGDTSGTALWNPATGSWARRVIHAVDPGLEYKLPPVERSDRCIGYLSQSLASEYGFSRECRLDAGSGDNMYGAVGTGNIKPGIVTISLGTSGTAYTFMKEPFIDPKGEIASFCDSTGHYLPLLCVSNLANGYDDFIKLNELSHDGFSRLVGQTRAGNRGRILVPWYTGERTPDVPLGTPVYFGFDLGDFTAEILARAVLEGHVLNLYCGFQRMPVKPIEIRLTGGLSNSEAWCQTIADVFEAETVPVKGEGAALGAALHAAWVWLREHDKDCSLEELVDAFLTLEEQRRKKPVEENVRIHRLQKRMFQAVCLKILGEETEDPFALHHDLIRMAEGKV